MTIMMCSFEGPPRILRLYGHGRVIRSDDAEYDDLLSQWFGGEAPHGARQIIALDFDLVQTSCGFGVPLFDYEGERENLQRWADSKSQDEIEDYWRAKNKISLDGLPTGICD